MHLTDSLAFGGLERLVFHFAERLDSRRYDGIFCSLQYDGVFGEKIRKLGREVLVLDKAPGFAPSLFGKLYRLFKLTKIDILHTHNFAPLLYGVIPARLAGVRVVVHTDHGRTAFPDLRRRMLAERWITKYVDAITAVSSKTKENLVRHEKINEKSVRVITNGIDLAVPPATKMSKELRDEWGIPTDAFVVGACCRLVEQKGLKFLLEAGRVVRLRNKRVHFLIAGDGPLKDQLEKLAKSLDIHESVSFIGFRDDVQNVLNCMDLYVLPSIFEGTPLGLLEAMLARRAVIATRVASNDEIIDHGVCGLIVPPADPQALADAIMSILGKRDLIERMGERACSKVRTNFSIDAMINKYDNLYQELILRQHDRDKSH
ncbi:glycosyltransferase [Candidatus Nitrospira bockiana]